MKNKKKTIIIAILISLTVVGGGFALNGYFGGGGNIPSDTMTRGLVAYWSFDEGTGTTTYDGSDNGNHGTFVTVASSPKWTNGKVGGALSFDGVDDYVEVPDSSSLNLANIITL